MGGGVHRGEREVMEASRSYSMPAIVSDSILVSVLYILDLTIKAVLVD